MHGSFPGTHINHIIAFNRAFPNAPGGGFGGRAPRMFPGSLCGGDPSMLPWSLCGRELAVGRPKGMLGCGGFGPRMLIGGRAGLLGELAEEIDSEFVLECG